MALVRQRHNFYRRSAHWSAILW